MPVDYISTRGGVPKQSFEAVLLSGLARDGGLFVPATWPSLSADRMAAWQGRTYAELAAEIMLPFVDDTIAEDTLGRMAREVYAEFGHAAVAPLVQLDCNLWLLELFHGPTIAFKDYALQLLGRLFDEVLARKGRRITIVGATSGDTGSAALEACRDRSAIDIFILYPEGRVTEVQRRQMTTIEAANVHCLAIKGTFDDCQNLVKALFNDHRFRDRHALSAVNSINWGRIVAQIVYYAVAVGALGGRPVRFAVPTGNFGNVFAAYAGHEMGLPIERLIIGTNRNDILHRFFRSGAMATETVMPTLSPSMDIQVSSNFERFLFDLNGRDGARTAAQMTGFARGGELTVDDGALARAGTLFSSYRCDDAQTLARMAAIHRRTGACLDPHSAIGVEAALADLAEHPQSTSPRVALGCAHPAKFPDAVERATGVRPALPPALADLYDRRERATILPAALDAVRRTIEERTRAIP